jgi:hypothetical protein
LSNATGKMNLIPSRDVLYTETNNESKKGIEDNSSLADKLLNDYNKFRPNSKKSHSVCANKDNLKYPSNKNLLVNPSKGKTASEEDLHFNEISPVEPLSILEENDIYIKSVVKLGNNKELNIDSTVNLVGQNQENYKGYLSVDSPKANTTKDTSIKNNKNIEVDSIEDMHIFFIKFFQQSKKILSLQEKGLTELSNKGSNKSTVVKLADELDYI